MDPERLSEIEDILDKLSSRDTYWNESVKAQSLRLIAELIYGCRKLNTQLLIAQDVSDMACKLTAQTELSNKLLKARLFEATVKPLDVGK